jgi:hypothetical protein
MRYIRQHNQPIHAEQGKNVQNISLAKIKHGFNKTAMMKSAL